MSNQPATLKPQPPWPAHTWLRWLAIWLIGVGIGLPLMAIIAGMRGEYLINTLVRAVMLAVNGSAIQTYVIADSLSTLLIALLPGAISGAVIGLGQWAVLLRRLRPVRIWILVSTCGGAIAWWTGKALFPLMQNLVLVFLRRRVMLDLGAADVLITAVVAGSTAGYLGGALAGSAQWLIRRHLSPFTVGWIIAMAIGWSIMWAVGSGLLTFIALQSPAIIN